MSMFTFELLLKLIKKAKIFLFDAELKNNPEIAWTNRKRDFEREKRISKQNKVYQIEYIN